MARRSGSERDHVFNDEARDRARCLRHSGLCREPGCRRYDCRSFRHHGRRLSRHRRDSANRAGEPSSRQRGHQCRSASARLDSASHLRLAVTSSPVRIAMWSGPRNISTAMMRAWGNRADTAVIDEPFSAYYLERTGKEHPGAEEVIAHGEIDWRKIVNQLTDAVPSGKPIFFQKQMVHHLLPEIDRGWMVELTNCFLIRDPREVILSYIKKNPEPTLEDLGFVQQLKIFDFVRGQANSVPTIVDAKDVLQNPERTLRLLCETIGVSFDAAMLSWPPGLRDTDGIWAKYWYDEVASSTSFQPYTPREGVVPERLREIYEQCRECYKKLHKLRLR